MAEVTELARTKGWRIGTFGDVFITVIHGGASYDMLKALEEHQGRFVAAKGKVVSLTVIASERLEPAQAEFREASAKLQAHFEPHLLCSGVVITTKGFAAVIARTFLAAYQLLVRYKTPHETFRDVASAAGWVHRIAPQPDGFAAALEKFCQPG
ncbi:MAG: hypothetical protein JNK82_24975 [Myxococcaceae bacterium]|nr:hypothetical protein [Myxococcaceae bacterium]